jgi:hypothetical protein
MISLTTQKSMTKIPRALSSRMFVMPHYSRVLVQSFKFIYSVLLVDLLFFVLIFFLQVFYWTTYEFLILLNNKIVLFTANWCLYNVTFFFWSHTRCPNPYPPCPTYYVKRVVGLVLICISLYPRSCI